MSRFLPEIRSHSLRRKRSSLSPYSGRSKLEALRGLYQIKFGEPDLHRKSPGTAHESSRELVGALVVANGLSTADYCRHVTFSALHQASRATG